MALLPLPAFVRRFQGPDPASGSGVAAVRTAATPAFDSIVQGAQKAAAIAASALVVCGSGATLGGMGPLAIDAGRAAGSPEQSAPAAHAVAGAGADQGARPVHTASRASGSTVAAGHARARGKRPSRPRPKSAGPRARSFTVPPAPAPPRRGLPKLPVLPSLPPAGDSGVLRPLSGGKTLKRPHPLKTVPQTGLPRVTDLPVPINLGPTGRGPHLPDLAKATKRLRAGLPAP